MLAWPAVSGPDNDESAAERPKVDASSGTESPPPELMRVVSGVTGVISYAIDVSWDHAESGVWVVEGRHRTVVLKAHRQQRKFEQELTAYREWLPQMRGRLPAGVDVPELLLAFEGNVRALALSFERGQRVEATVLLQAEERDVHRRAGAFLGALHGLPFKDDDPIPLDAAYRARMESWLQRSEGIVPGAVALRVKDRVSEALPRLATERRVRCHRDFTPRNWLVDAGGSLVIIDFEHSRPDWRLADLERLWTGLWRRRPDLERAFLDGYGGRFSADDEQTLRSVSALGALATVTWAREHDDAAFERHGWEVIKWLGLTR